MSVSRLVRLLLISLFPLLKAFSLAPAHLDILGWLTGVQTSSNAESRYVIVMICCVLGRRPSANRQAGLHAPSSSSRAQRRAASAQTQSGLCRGYSTVAAVSNGPGKGHVCGIMRFFIGLPVQPDNIDLFVLRERPIPFANQGSQVTPHARQRSAWCR